MVSNSSKDKRKKPTDVKSLLQKYLFADVPNSWSKNTSPCLECFKICIDIHTKSRGKRKELDYFQMTTVKLKKKVCFHPMFSAIPVLPATKAPLVRFRCAKCADVCLLKFCNNCFLLGMYLH
jgi:hypothetical protein